MQPLMSYFTVKGWKLDWDESLFAAGKKIRRLEARFRKLGAEHDALQEKYAQIQGLEERYKRFDGLEQLASGLDESRKAIGDVQEFRLQKWAGVADAWVARLEALESGYLAGYRLIPKKDGEDSFEKVHAELFKIAGDNIYSRLLQSALSCGRSILAIYDDDYRSEYAGRAINLADKSEYNVNFALQSSGSPHRKILPQFAELYLRKARPGSYEFDIRDDDSYSGETLIIKHNVPHSIEKVLQEQHPELPQELAAAFFMGLAANAIIVPEAGIRSAQGPSKAVFERVLNYSIRMVNGRLNEVLLAPLIKENPQLADYVAPLVPPSPPKLSLLK